MHVEVLTEDRSGASFLKIFLERLLNSYEMAYSLAVRPHRGKGEWPKDIYAPPSPLASGLIDLLPAKLRAYDRIYAGTDLILIIVVDADKDSPEWLKNRIGSLCQRFAPQISSVIGISVEEIEAWMLGDKQAILLAYPEADKTVLQNYQQDSICGTWEILCQAILGQQAEGLLRLGYPAIGQFKQEWAENIARHTDISQNRSPSLAAFVQELVSLFPGYNSSKIWEVERV